MREFTKRLIKVNPAYRALRRWLWTRAGKPAPPPHTIKQDVLIEFSKRFQLKNLVETGTFEGRMIDAMLQRFRKIYSIELSVPMYQRATKKFENQPHVNLICGDSSAKIAEVLPQLEGPALFWLDGHYSGGETALGDKICPVLEELEDILTHEEQNHVIVIDDARLFGVEDSGYPTVEELRDFVQSKRSDMTISIDTDSIRIVPSEQRFAA